MKLFASILTLVTLSTVSLRATDDSLAQTEKHICQEHATILKELASGITSDEERTPIAALEPVDDPEIISCASYYSSHCDYIPVNWPMFAKNFGAESFLVRLPSTPVVGDDGEMVVYNAFDYSIYPNPLYGVNFHIDPILHADPGYVFKKVLRMRQESPYHQLISYSFGAVEGYPAMDMHLYDLETRVLHKERVIVSDYDVYFLYTLYYAGLPEFHQYFIDSFMF